MTSTLQDDEIAKIAKARVGFKIHAFVYVAVNLFLTAIWFVTTRAAAGADDYFWPLWPMMGWGLGLAIHGFVVYGGGLDWQRREEERLRRRMRGS